MYFSVVSCLVPDGGLLNGKHCDVRLGASSRVVFTVTFLLPRRGLSLGRQFKDLR